MPYNNGLIVSPVSISDVQNALGNSSTDLATLCKASTVKRWAKYKPQEAHTSRYVQVLTDAQRASADWGIKNIPIWSNKTIANVIQFWTGADHSSTNQPDCGIKNEYWEWNAPSTAYRLTDFVSGGNPTTIGYFTGAEAPIYALDEASLLVTTLTFVYKMNLGGISTGHTLWYGDFAAMNSAAFKNMYFGVMMKCGSSYYLATQDNTVGDLSTSGNTLWSMGASVHILIGSSSGALKTYIDNDTAFPVFPVFSTVKNYVAGTAIAPIGGTTPGSFVTLLDSQNVVIAGQTYIKGVVVTFSAWKDNSSAPRKDLRICYSLRIVANDGGSHYFNVTLTAKDANGNQVGNNNVTLNAQSPYQPTSEGAPESPTPFIDLNYSNAGVTRLYLKIEKGSNAPAAEIYQTVETNTVVYNDVTPY